MKRTSDLERRVRRSGGAVRNRSGEYGALKNAAIAAMKRKNDKKRERAEITEELINGTYAYPKYLIDHPASMTFTLTTKDIPNVGLMAMVDPSDDVTVERGTDEYRKVITELCAAVIRSALLQVRDLNGQTAEQTRDFARIQTETVMWQIAFEEQQGIERATPEELEEAMERMSEGDIEGLFDLGISVRKAEPGFRDHLPEDQRYGFQPYGEGEEDE